MKYAPYYFKNEGSCNEACARQLCKDYGTTLPRVHSKNDFDTLVAVM